MQSLRIPSYLLCPTQTTIFGFNSSGTHLVCKIKLKCQIGDLKTELTCYVIGVEMSYNLLLGMPWTRCNGIVPSTLHQVMKYANEQGVVRTLIANWNPFKGVENYYTDSLLY